MNISSFAVTHIGMVRKLNEDSFLDKCEEGTWAVADGMGGHDAGDKASQAVVETVGRIRQAPDFQQSVERLQELILEVNDRLVHLSEDQNRNHKPGSTIASLLIQGAQGAVVWAGDSRVYRRRLSGLEQLTRDHSHVQELLDNRLISPEEAEHHPMGNVITRAIGIDSPLELDTRTFSVSDGDAFLLCSDGLSHLVSDEEISAMMDNPEPEEVIQSLLHTALIRGAPDNVTLIYVSCGDDEDESTLVMKPGRQDPS